MKSRFSIISVSGFRKRQKKRTNMARCSSPENYYSSGRNTELKLCRLWSIYLRGNRQTKKSGFSTSPVPLSLAVGVAFAVLIDVPSAPRFLVDVFSFVVHAEFEVGVLAPEEFRWKIFLGEDLEPAIWSHLLCLCVTQFGECDSLTNPVCAVAEPGAHAEN